MLTNVGLRVRPSITAEGNTRCDEGANRVGFNMLIGGQNGRGFPLEVL